MAETESVPVTVPEDLVPTRGAGGSMLDRWVNTDPEAAIKRVDIMVKLLESLRAASIRATYPSDWIIHTSTDRDGTIIKQVGYLQDSGAERAAKTWGIEVGNPAIEREDFPDGTYTYHMLAEAWSKVTGERLDYVEGSRWSGDRFFQRRSDDERIDPTDVRKSAYANLHGRAVRALGGLNGVPIEILLKAGVDTAKVVHVNYVAGAKGGDSSGAATVGSSEPVVAFGQSKGKKVSELADKDLGWYIGAYSENVSNQEKAKYRTANQRVLDALLREKEKRDQATAHATATGAEVPAQNGKPAEAPKAGDAMEDATPRGKLIGDVWTRLTDAAGKKAIPLLQLLTEQMEGGTKRSAMSECTDAELAFLAKIPEANLSAVAKTLQEKK